MLLHASATCNPIALRFAPYGLLPCYSSEAYDFLGRMVLLGTARHCLRSHGWHVIEGPCELLTAGVMGACTWKAPESCLAAAQVRDNVAIHVPCTSKKLGVTGAFEQIAALCAKEVTPSGIPCCGEPSSQLRCFKPCTARHPMLWPCASMAAEKSRVVDLASGACM